MKESEPEEREGCGVILGGRVYKDFSLISSA